MLLFNRKENEYDRNSLGITQDICTAAGCISEKELKLMGIGSETYTKNLQNRNGCLYCYWKD